MTDETARGARGTDGRLDKLGMAASVLCALHCALAPAVVALLPVAGLTVLAGEWAESASVGLCGTLGVVSLGLGYRRHRSGRALVILAVGLFLLAAGRVAESREIEAPGLVSAVAGGLVVAGAHRVNRRLCRSCEVCRDIDAEAIDSPPPVSGCRRPRGPELVTETDLGPATRGGPS